MYNNIFVGNNENLGVFRTLKILIDIIQNLKQLLKYLLDFLKYIMIIIVFKYFYYYYILI